MKKKPKITGPKTLSRSSGAGLFLAKKSGVKASAAAMLTQASRGKRLSSTQAGYEPKLAHPIAQTVDAQAFARELLVTDAIVLDILSK